MRLNPGYPIANPNAPRAVQAMQGFVPPQGLPVDYTKVKPEMIIAQMDPNRQRARAPSMAARRDSEMQVNASTYGLSTDKSDSVLAQAKWMPDAAYDAALREKLAQFQAPVKVGGRSTLMQGFAQGRVMSDVPLERVPDAIRAIAEEADRESMAQKKKEVDPALSSSKKRKIQDVADNVDKGLKIDGEVEHVSSLPI